MCAFKCLALSMLLFLVYQMLHISHHHRHVYELNRANPHEFVRKFDLLPLSRTIKHDKSMDYWLDWIEFDAPLLIVNKTATLLHFDLHGIDDNSDQHFHICTAANLLSYDEFVKQTLDAVYATYFDDFDAAQNLSVTRHAMRKGYINEFVWIFPDHWLNYSQSTVMEVDFAAFRNLIYFHSFYINPKEQLLFYVQDNTTDNDELWHRLFHEGSHPMIAAPEPMSAFDNLEINIWALSLSQYLNEPHFMGPTDGEHRNVLFDVDLDFFQCQEPAETLMNHFDWNPGLVTQFNQLLQHHQYVPSHMFAEYSNEAIVTLLHLLVTNDTDLKQENATATATLANHSMPQIEDIFEVALQEGMDIETIERALYLLYEYQMERSTYEHDTVHHLVHFDVMFDVLHRARRQLQDFDVIAANYERAPHLVKRPYSQHWLHMHDLAVKLQKKQQFEKEYHEVMLIKDEREHSLDIHNEFEAAANRMIQQRRRRQLMSAETEIDANGQQTQRQNESAPNDAPFMLSAAEWTDQQLKDLMNMTTDYLYHDWQTVLFDSGEDEEWKSKYPQWIAAKIKRGEDVNMTQHTSNIAVSKHAPYNQHRSSLKRHEIPQQTIQERRKSFQPKLDDLDAMQQHFLSRANHEQLRSFIRVLNTKQRAFLEWLVLCYYHNAECQGMHYLPHKFNKSFHFGYDFQWTEVNGWPQLIAQPEKSEGLQLEILRFHSPLTSFVPAEASEIAFVPTAEYLDNMLSSIARIIQQEQVVPIMVGVELSPAHLPKAHRYDIECRVYRLFQQHLYKHPHKPCFTRLTKLNDDTILPYMPCVLA